MNALLTKKTKIADCKVYRHDSLNIVVLYRGGSRNLVTSKNRLFETIVNGPEICLKDLSLRLYKVLGSPMYIYLIVFLLVVSIATDMNSSKSSISDGKIFN